MGLLGWVLLALAGMGLFFVWAFGVTFSIG